MNSLLKSIKNKSSKIKYIKLDNENILLAINECNESIKSSIIYSII